MTVLPRLELRVTPRLFQHSSGGCEGPAAWTAALQPANGVDGGFNHLEGAVSRRREVRPDFVFPGLSPIEFC
jgi:hypothetical protein